MKFQTTKEQKAKGCGKLIAFIKKHKKTLCIIAVGIVAVVIVICVVLSALLNAKVAKIKAGLEGKFFYSETSSGAQMYAFKDGKIANEYWSDGKRIGNILSYEREYKVSAKLFDDRAAIKESYKSGWQQVMMLDVSFDTDGNIKLYYRGNTLCREVTLEEIENERKLHICIEHTFGDPVIIKEATCSSEGTEKLVCTNCGYEKIERKTLPHNYVNGVCTECGAQNLTVKSDIEADTWYVYKPLDLLKFQNCVVVNASPFGSKAIAVQYFSVCKECHMIEQNGEGLPRMTAPELNYPVQKMYHCGKCGETTVVRLEIIQ